MPEIGEVARVVHYLRKHTLNRTIASCTAVEDTIVYGKVGTSASEFQKATANRRITGVGQQGKYFYVTFEKSPHAVMHLGMTGWVKFSSEETGYYRSKKESEEVEEWPPKYMKWLMRFEKEGDKEQVEVAFVDPRRLARIRLVDCEASEVRNHSPLKENGPDPVVDKDKFTFEFLQALLGKKKVPVKALLLDQANISGIGNWVADEVLYQARLHPEQYSNTFTPENIKRLHDSITSICTTACETLADSAQFPETWLMKYRWDKGKKGADANVLPNGEKIVHLKVGGRASAIVPSVQKKTAAVAGDVDGEDDAESKPANGRKRKVKSEDEEDDEEKPVPKKAAAKGRGTANGKTAKVKQQQDSDDDADVGAEESKNVEQEEEEAEVKPKKAAAITAAKKKQEKKPAKPTPATGSRRSARTKAT